MAHIIRLVVVDVDGCLTPGEGGAWDWEALGVLQDLNARARRGEAAPAITLCTGRQEPYVEAMMQAIGGFVPCVYENGCGLYLPDGYRFLEHQAITPEVRATLAAAKTRLYNDIVAPGLGYFQPGKEVSLSVYPAAGRGVRSMRQRIVASLSGLPETLTLHTSATCVDITPAGIDKGQGVRWLAEVTQIALQDMGGIGDSPGDLAFLRLVGASAAPANAMAQVKEHAHYVSPFRNGKGVVDIVAHWMQQTSS